MKKDIAYSANGSMASGYVEVKRVIASDYPFAKLKTAHAYLISGYEHANLLIGKELVGANEVVRVTLEMEVLVVNYLEKKLNPPSKDPVLAELQKHGYR